MYVVHVVTIESQDSYRRRNYYKSTHTVVLSRLPSRGDLDLSAVARLRQAVPPPDSINTTSTQWIRRLGSN
jgi:hypothetical protein